MLRRVGSLLLCPAGGLQSPVAMDRRLDPLMSFVRWRKRRWSPITPSKLFRVTVKAVPGFPGETEELKLLYDRYKAALRSMKFYLREDLALKAAALTDRSHVEDEQKHLAQCLQENTLFNRISAEAREKRETVLIKKLEEEKLEAMIKMEAEEITRLEEARKDVLQAMRESERFITKENLLASIEEALNQRNHYDFAIDTDGQRYIDGKSVAEKSDVISSSAHG